jgi:hypothetical protein
VSSYDRRKASRQRAARAPRSRATDRAGRRVDRRDEKSTYEGRYTQGPVTFVLTRTGKFLGVERDGEFEPARPCCTNPLECHRPECWRPFTAGDIE